MNKHDEQHEEHDLTNYRENLDEVIDQLLGVKGLHVSEQLYLLGALDSLDYSCI